MKLHQSNKLQLFLTFLKIGAFTFGGGYAMIPIIQKEVVDKKKWLTEEDILDVVAIAESTPGPIAINAATFVGYKVAGFFGALCSTLGVVLPSFLIILLVSVFYKKFSQAQVVKNAFWGIRIAVLALILNALLALHKQSPKKLFTYVIAFLAFVAVVFFKLNIILIIVLAAIAGLVYEYAGKEEK